MNRLLLIFFTLTTVAFGQWFDGQDAIEVLGQPNYETYLDNAGEAGFYHPGDIAIDYNNSVVYVADKENNRVLRFAYPISNFSFADAVFGQPDFNSNMPECSNIGMNKPVSVAVYEGNLYVCDQGNRRILRFDSAYNSPSGDAADLVYGHEDFNTDDSDWRSAIGFGKPMQICIDDDGDLWVADSLKNRVFGFLGVNNDYLNETGPSVTLGQPDCFTLDPTTSVSGVSAPCGVTAIETKLFVADAGNNRVLVYDNPTGDGANACSVIGQADFDSNTSGNDSTKFNCPTYLETDDQGRLYVADRNNGRVLIFNDAVSRTFITPANNILGWNNFKTPSSTNGGKAGFYLSADLTTRAVHGICWDKFKKHLWVVDGNNNRILRFKEDPSLPVELTNLSVVVLNETVALSWKTATEKNNYGFEVEKLNNSEWEKIGFVKGNGNSNSAKAYSFSDSKPVEGKIVYRLKQIDFDGKYEYSKEIEVTYESVKEFTLDQNYPNPFNPTTNISFKLAENGKVSIKIFNAIGQEVAELVNKTMEAGRHEVTFNASNLPSGTYFCRITAGSLTKSSKMLLIK